MIILGKTVSAKTEKLVSEIERNLSKPVQYSFTDPQKTLSYGQSDPWKTDAYYVYSKESLFNLTKKNQFNIPFETNILHELTHLCQAEEGYPHTSTVYNQQTFSNTALYDVLGSMLVSSVLDLNVDYRLKQEGYTSEYFYKHRIIQAEKTARKGIKALSEIAFIQYACMFMCLKLSYQGDDLERILMLYRENNPPLIACVDQISQEISAIGFQSPEACFRSLVFLFDAFNLWCTHWISFHETTYISLQMVRDHFPDIRTLEPVRHSAQNLSSARIYGKQQH